MRSALFIAIGVAFAATSQAQWLNYRVPGTPVKPDGKVDLTAPAPRAPDGKPDLTGVWHLQRGPSGPANNVTAGPAGVDPGSLTANIFRDMKPEDIPEKPEAAKVRIERTKDGKRLNPSVFCLPMGIPTANFLTEVTKFVQAPKEIIIMHEVDGTHRQIYTDGRPLPKDPSPAWLGYSTARWDGDTLVVETEGFNDKTWLDMNGHSHSEALHVTERYHRRDFGHMDVEMTFNDPLYYSRPFTIKFTHELVPDSDVLESFCAENEKSRAHILEAK